MRIDYASSGLSLENASRAANDLRKRLDKLPDKAGNFQFSGFEVDSLEFCDRPYLGANSIITNGASDFFPGAPFETKHPLKTSMASVSSG